MCSDDVLKIKNSDFPNFLEASYFAFCKIKIKN